MAKIIFYTDKDREGALAYLTTPLKEKPNLAAYNILHIKILLSLNRSDEALEQANSAISNHPDNKKLDRLRKDALSRVQREKF